jgi:hypothetical protein
MSSFDSVKSKICVFSAIPYDFVRQLGAVGS